VINRAEHLGAHGVLLLRNIWGQNPEKKLCTILSQNNKWRSMRHDKRIKREEERPERAASS